MRFGFGFLAAAGLALLAPAGAQAATTIPWTFDLNGCSTATSAVFQCSTSTLGGFATETISARGNANVQVVASAWQVNQTSGAVNQAYLGAYSGAQGTAAGGLGVTGYGDSTGSGSSIVYGGGGTHQIDNVNGYTDLVMLQFSQAVRITGANTYVYGLTGYSNDSDMSVLNASGLGLKSNSTGVAITQANWSSMANLIGATAALSTSTWTQIAGTGASTTGRAISAGTGFSNVWLVSASTLTTDRNDGFKLSMLTVETQGLPTPEPATWATLIVGFGAIGATLRRRRAAGLVAA